MSGLGDRTIQRVEQDILALSKIVDETMPGYTRRPFTKWHKESREWLVREMEKCGLAVHIDAASNLVGRREGTNRDLPPIMIGSHTDSVVGGGRFDGVIGVVAGIEIVRQLNEKNLQLAHPLLVVDFTAEEASEFGISTIGSRGMVGDLAEEDLNRQNEEGLTLREAFRLVGGRPEDLEKEALKEGDLALYLELHIEQGPVLEENAKELGVVTGIVGIQRFEVIVEGEANHAGTTPMDMRYDALAAASELVLKIEEIANMAYTEQVVGTVGRLLVEPNGPNIVPGRVVFDFEIRSLDVHALEQMEAHFRKEMERVQRRRKVSITSTQLSYADPVVIEEKVLAGIEKSCQKLGATLRLPSGAGHDGMQIAGVSPVGMIFVPSKDGKSHCPEEWTDYEQVARGIHALGNTVLYFDKEMTTKEVRDVESPSSK